MDMLSFKKVIKGVENSALLPIEGYSENGFKYYCPNDEGSGYGIIAVHHEEQLAADTGFFETDDFYPDSGYTPAIYKGKVVCTFEIK